MNDIRRYWGGLLAFGVFLVLVALADRIGRRDDE